MSRGRKRAGTERTSLTRQGVQVAAAALACVWMHGTASDAPDVAGSASETGWRLTVAMDEVVHVDEPFTLRVRLWHPGEAPAKVLIRHHLEEEIPFMASFRSLSGTYYGAFLARGDVKEGLVVRSHYPCEHPPRRGPDCPSVRNVYLANGAGYVELAEVVTLREYEGFLSERFSPFTGLVAGPHLMKVWVAFVESPEDYMLDVRNRIERPLTRLEAEFNFDLETDGRDNAGDT